jgi:hypothetical protein
MAAAAYAAPTQLVPAGFAMAQTPQMQDADMEVDGVQ